MKRYKMVNAHGQSVFKYDGIIQEEHKDGEWVQFEDVKHLRSLVDEAIDEIKSLKLAAIKSDTECNCKRMCKERVSTVHPALPWLCPAHGYKRL